MNEDHPCFKCLASRKHAANEAVSSELALLDATTDLRSIMNVVVNALKTDENAGKRIRGEMATELVDKFDVLAELVGI